MRGFCIIYKKIKSQRQEKAKVMASRVVHIPIPDGHCGIRLSGLICQIRELGGINAVDTDENGRYLSVTYDPAVTNEEYVLRYLRQKSFEAH